MQAWRCNEQTLASFHVERSFYFELLREVRPWIERAQHVRSCVYLNATDGARKDQRDWMYLYEQMIVDRKGEKFRFLPKQKEPPPEKEPARGRNTAAPAEPARKGFVRVTRPARNDDDEETP